MRQIAAVMDYDQWQSEVIKLMADHCQVSEAEIAGECQDMEDMHADGLTPDEARAELCAAIA